MTINRRTALGQFTARALMLPVAGSLLWQSRALAVPTTFTDIGPFYPVARSAEEDGDLTLVGKSRRAAGQVIEIVSRVLDAKGHALPPLEIWQANAAGRYAQPATPTPPRAIRGSRGPAE